MGTKRARKIMVSTETEFGTKQIGWRVVHNFGTDDEYVMVNNKKKRFDWVGRKGGLI